MGGGMMNFGLGALGWLWMLLFWGGLVLLVVWLVSLLFPAAKKRPGDDSSSPSPKEILKTRYARGELTTEQYKEMLNTLQK